MRDSVIDILGPREDAVACARYQFSILRLGQREDVAAIEAIAHLLPRSPAID